MRRTGKTVLALVTLSLANSCESIDLLAFPEPGDPHFGDLTGQAMEQPDGRWLATVTVTVHGADENLKEGVTVGASWSTGASGSCITGSDGQCPISLSLPDSTSTVMFKVDSLSRDSDSYAPASNDISNTVTVSMPATGETIVPEWFADHEDGTLREWNDGGGLYNTNDYTVVDSAEHAHTGTRSVKTTIYTTSGSSAVRLFRWAESRTGADLYYSAWAYFPAYHKPSMYWNVMQFKSKRSTTENDPIFTLNVGNDGAGGAMRLYVYYHGSYLGGSDRSYDQSLNPTDLPVGRWVHLEAFLRQAGDKIGIFRFWQDGTLIFDIGNIQTRYPDGDNQWAIGNYSNGLNPPVATIYFDDTVIARERVYGRSVKGMQP
jgi:hypothetical protein